MRNPTPKNNQYRLNSSEWTERWGERAPEIGTDPFADDYGGDDPRTSEEREADRTLTTYPQLAYQDYETEEYEEETRNG